MDRRALLGGMLLWPLAGRAAPAAYALDPARTEVAFGFTAGGLGLRGTMPVTRAALSLDLREVGRSSVEVALDARAVRTRSPFAQGPLREVLDVARHPELRFASRRIARADRGADMAGEMTIRGVTRTETLRVRLARLAGNDPADLTELDLLVDGAIDRQDYGIVEYSGLVADRVTLSIRAVIRRI